MTSLAFVLQPVNLLILGVFLFLIFVLLTLLYVYLNIHRIRRKKELNAAIEEKRLAYEKPPPSTVDPKANRFAFPLVKVSGPPISEVISETNSKSPIPSNYKTFDFARRAHRHLSSDSSYTSSNPRHSASTSFPFDTVKSKFQQIQRRSTPSPTSSRQLETISSDQRSLQVTSDSDEEFLPAPATPTFEYSLAGYFRIEWIYKVFYSIDHRQLLFQLVQFKSMQPMIERCFPSLICKVRLFTHNGKRKGKKYFSKKDSVNEIFKFDMDQYTLDESYLKIQFYGQKKNEKRLELAQTVLVLNQFENLTLRTPHHHDDGLKNSQEHVKSLPIIEDRIEMITRAQNPAENEARALISLVYENDRCLLHVGVIKIAAIQSLVKPLIEHSNHRSDAIQIKICTTMDGKTLSKEKSKFLAVEKDSFSFSTSFHLDYLSLHKISVCISIFYRKSLIGSQGKLLSSLEFGSTQLKSQQSFQHWTDTLSGPTKPHIHWHTLQPNPMIKDK